MKLPFSDYSIGAGIATDLVNTSALVRRSTGEVLVDPAALGRFLGEHRIPVEAAAAGSHPSEADLEQVLALRRELRALLESDSADQLAEGANALVRKAGVGPLLARDTDGHWQWYVSTGPRTPLADELAALIGTGLLGVLRTLSHDRVRHCASPECDGMFVDTSKAGRRRYCMPDLCGNRLNVARHRARRLADAAEADDA
ncbi:CGNR zinc finger domain-containing protein [Streptomyces violens]|uniref:CGNR zinc finger domain-containing protein n=1 Tax=Streptomyces violens TaxID=66377 RepID=UPI0004C20B14|nr:CGNR zinc finger domain-containing protein [Streptomyces violens]